MYSKYALGVRSRNTTDAVYAELRKISLQSHRNTNILNVFTRLSSQALAKLGNIVGQHSHIPIVARMFEICCSEHAQTFLSNICCSALRCPVWPPFRATILPSTKYQHAQCCVAKQYAILVSNKMACKF